MSALCVVFLGPPGTGKGTQAQRLSRQLGLVAMSSGDVLRREIADGSVIGRQAEAFVKSGALVPDDVITGVMLSFVDRVPREPGFVLDGFPRTVPQAEALEHGFHERDIRLSAVFDFVLKDEAIVARVAGRCVCGNCAAVYNNSLLPPRQPGRCDRCGGELIQRADDRPEVILARLETYRRQTAPLVDYYRRLSLLHTVDASLSAEQVEADLIGLIAALAGADRRGK